MMRTPQLLLVLSGLLCPAAFASAQPAPPANNAPAGPPSGALSPAVPPQGMLAPATSGPPAGTLSAPTNLPDTVTLNDGSTLTGRVLAHDPQSYVILRMDDGRDIILSNKVVTNVARGAAAGPPRGLLSPGAPPPSGPTIEVEEKMAIDTKAGTFTHEIRTGEDIERTLLDARAGTLTRQEIDANGNITTYAVGPKAASYTATADCSDPSSPVCQQERKVEVSGAGLQASYHRTAVEGVKEPPKGYSTANIAAGGTLIVGDVTAYGGNVSASYFAGLGGKLPGADGGSWIGVGIDLGAQLSYISMEGAGGSGLLNVGGALGLTGLHFGKLDVETLKQSGFGWLLGARAGANLQFSPSSDPAFSIGPQIKIAFPKYNAGTAKVSDTNITLFVLPTGGIVVIMAQLGFGLSL
jgi:hypothetical protein